MFDQPGVYSFPAEILDVPALHTLTGVDGVVLRAGSAGRFLVRGGGRWRLCGIELDGANLVDFVVMTASADGTTSGGVCHITDCVLRNAIEAVVWGFGSTFVMERLNVYGGRYGVLLEACSESSLTRIACALQSQSSLCVRGSHAGPDSLYSDAPIANGGRVSVFNFIAGVPGQHGIDFDGAAQSDVHGATIEGAAASAIRVRGQSSNIRVFGLRTNGAEGSVSVDFERCYNAYVYGGCTASQRVVHRAESAACGAFLSAESMHGAFDILQEWQGPSGSWFGFARPDGSLVAACSSPTSLGVCPSTATTAPTSGRWRSGDVVWNPDPGEGQPAGWRFDGNTWRAFGMSRGAIVAGTPSGTLSAEGVDVLLATYHLHTLSGGHDGQRVTVVCNVSQIWLGDFSGGNLFLDGGGAPGRMRWVMRAGDTCTLLRLTDTAGVAYWRELSRSVANA